MLLCLCPVLIMCSVKFEFKYGWLMAYNNTFWIYIIGDERWPKLLDQWEPHNRRKQGRPKQCEIKYSNRATEQGISY